MAAKVPPNFDEKSLASVKISDLKNEEWASLEAILGQLDVKEEISPDQNLVFLAELYLTEKMKGNKANKDALATIESIVISADVLQKENNQKNQGKTDQPVQVHHSKTLKNFETPETMLLERAKNRVLGIEEYANRLNLKGKEREKLLNAMKGLDSVIDVQDTKSPEFKSALRLFKKAFPNPDEREPNSAIIERIKDMQAIDHDSSLQAKYGDSRFHSLIGMKSGKVAFYSQFSVMPIDNEQMVVYGQYSCVEENQRKEGMYQIVYASRNGLALEDTQKLGYKNVVGTIFESEFKGQGGTPEDREYTQVRLNIHSKMGGMALMLVMPDGSLRTPHIQPRLDESSNPIILHIFFNPLEKHNPNKRQEIPKELAQKIMLSFIDNFDREGFVPKDVQDARDIVSENFRNAKGAVLVPSAELPNYLELSKSYPLLAEQCRLELKEIMLVETKNAASITNELAKSLENLKQAQLGLYYLE